MSSFTGTSKDFHYYIGPSLTNLIQRKTKKLKAAVGACQHCGSEENLESAHLNGRDRQYIINSILENNTHDNIVTVKLEEFLKTFTKEHDPLEKSILILCFSCHRAYDSKDKSPSNNDNEILPISLNPSNSDAFKQQLLLKRLAQIEIFYDDGRKAEKTWNAIKFSETSNLLGNLRSRAEFRAGVWQAEKIVKIHVSIVT